MVHCTDVVSKRNLGLISYPIYSIIIDPKRSYSLCALVIQKAGPQLNSTDGLIFRTATFGERTPVILTKVGIRNPCQLGFIAVGPFCPS
ncbi:hypothetical protein DTO166G4_3160 [Paecilomyces variotii]|nr:hypothetical protein DTO166G4_3160 [Paecilomyces variotii]KAJ9233812.1 hypothetical protein DTO166G5_5473 [Paecilomyces variotii]